MSTLADGLTMAWIYYSILGVFAGAFLCVRYRDDPSYRLPLSAFGKMEPSPWSLFWTGYLLWPVVLWLMFNEDNDKER